MENKPQPFQFNIFTFMIGVSVGLLYVYLATPHKKVVVKYPTPYNVGKVEYNAEDNTCYVYESKEVPCPKDRANVKPQPIV
jgi:hypothetical protein